MAEVYKIVIADDEALICMDLKEMLEEAGHEVVGVGSDGVEALGLTKLHKTVELPDNAATRGMIKQVQHLVC